MPAPLPKTPPQPLDLRHARATLEVPDGATAQPVPWLEQSWKTPETFFADLFATSSQRSGVLRSSLEGGTSLYHDLVMRHQRSAVPALRYRDRRGDWQSLTYEALHTRATERSAQWEASGIKPGAHIGILLPPGPELWVAFGAAMRLGVCFCVLPLEGLRSIARALEASLATHVITLRAYQPLLEGLPVAQILEDGPVLPRRGVPAPHTYARGELAALLLSPCLPAETALSPCPAGVLLAHALRDYALVYHLDPGEALAHPGAQLLQHLPLHALSTLAGGGTYIHASLNELRGGASDWPEPGPKTLIVEGALRDRLLLLPPVPLSVRLWLVSPEEPLVWERWIRLVEQRGLAQVLHGNVVLDPAYQGVALASRLRRGRLTTLVQPPPGLPPLDDEALEKQLSGADPAVSRLLLRVGHEWAYVGTKLPARLGRVYPMQEVLDVVQAPGVLGTLWTEPLRAALLELPLVSVPQSRRFVLLVFLGECHLGLPAETLSGLRRALQLRIASALGNESLPDRLELLPMAARLEQDQVDVRWCQRLYLSGRLLRRAQDPVFRAIQEVRAALKAEEG